MLVLVAQFMLINPWLHGLVLGVILLGAFPQLRNYLNGRIVQFDRGVRVGQRLHTQRYDGTILQIERLGIRLQSGEGIHFLDYSHLLSEGYTLLNSEEMGGFYQLTIALPADSHASSKSWQSLQDRLVNVPYFNWWHQPKWSLEPHAPGQFHARIAVHDEQHLQDFIALLREWGYQAKIVNR
ncbi:MAG: hypothetical protein D6772_09890 [Bacteroidetes bacterium]|nr:MAG: hypothetical protein D6772_09890 [Bacteroidota bacterium]